MKPSTRFWKFTSLSAVLLAAALALPQPLEAQRAVPRGGGDGGQSSGSGGGSQDRGGDRTPTPSPRGGGTSGGSSGGGERRAAPPQTSSPQAAAPRSNTDARADDDSAQTRDDNGGSSSSARRRGNNPQTGVAVDRRVRPGDGGTIVVPGGWYPWGWGGYGFAGYYGFYDPWYSGYGYGYGYRGQYYPRRDDGSVRLKVRPRDASVYVDGYYAGTVDDFDGIFQALPLEPGPHRIELQLDGYAPLTFDVRVLPDRKITFEEEMKPIEP